MGTVEEMNNIVRETKSELKNTLNMLRTTNELSVVQWFILDKDNFTHESAIGGFTHAWLAVWTRRVEHLLHRLQLGGTAACEGFGTGEGPQQRLLPSEKC